MQAATESGPINAASVIFVRHQSCFFLLLFLLCVCVFIVAVTWLVDCQGHTYFIATEKQKPIVMLLGWIRDEKKVFKPQRINSGLPHSRLDVATWEKVCYPTISARSGTCAQELYLFYFSPRRYRWTSLVFFLLVHHTSALLCCDKRQGRWYRTSSQPV